VVVGPRLGQHHVKPVQPRGCVSREMSSAGACSRVRARIDRGASTSRRIQNDG
jgi:hypothetical protein